MNELYLPKKVPELRDAFLSFGNGTKYFSDNAGWHAGNYCVMSII